MISEEQLDGLFAPGCDPYRAGAAALFGKPPAEVTQDERDAVKRVFARMAACRRPGGGDTLEQALRRSADLFHEIGAALAVERLLADVRNAILAAKLREKQRSSDQLRTISADGFELCVRALAMMGAADVTIHECGKSAFGEEPWGADDRPRCTGTLVHDEFTTCPVHDRRDR